MTIVIMAFAVWFSAIMFGPWAIKKYAENRFGDLVTLHNVNVNSKLEAKINRIDFNQDNLKSSSITGIEIRWSLLPEPKLIFEASGANYDDQFSLSNITAEITKTNNDINFPIEIDVNAENLMMLRSSNISEIQATVLSNIGFSELKNFKATSGNINLQTPFALVAESGVLEADEIGILAGKLKIDDQILFTLNNAASKKLLATADRILGTLTLDMKDIGFSVVAHNAKTNDSVFSAEEVVLVSTYDADASKIGGEATLAIENGKLFNLKFLHSNIKTSRKGDDLIVLAEGVLERNDLELQGRYIGNLPETRYQISLNVEANATSSSILSKAELKLQSEPSIILKATGFSNVRVSNFIDGCILSECELDRIRLEYSLETDGAQMSGVSDCAGLTCAAELSNHELITSDTNKFFTSIQRSGLISPLILAAAYAQMLGGEVNGRGHNLRF